MVNLDRATGTRLAAAIVLVLASAPPALAATSEPIAIPRPKPPHQAALNSGWPQGDMDAARAACDGALKSLDIRYAPQPPLGRPGHCGAPAPVEVTEIAGVRLEPTALLTCPMAAGLHQWITTAVQPAARNSLKTQVTVIHVAASYVCRSRNGVAGAKLSEHGRVNALDMSGFDFANRDAASVAGDWGSPAGTSGRAPEGSFLAIAQKAACPIFTTVLGPGSDPYHGSHFHLDLIARKNGWRICQ